ncbi:hypothetical protein L211DRAFT_888302, partial [Terfezia boudieri ATCC MYA-4762]
RVPRWRTGILCPSPGHTLQGICRFLPSSGGSDGFPVLTTNSGGGWGATHQMPLPAPQSPPGPEPTTFQVPPSAPHGSGTTILIQQNNVLQEQWAYLLHHHGHH